MSDARDISGGGGCGGGRRKCFLEATGMIL